MKFNIKFDIKFVKMDIRKLTDREIEYIIEDINILSYDLPKDSIECILHKKRSELKRQLKNIEIYPSQIKQLKKVITETYINSRINEGENVGISCAQGIGEKQTQSTLNSFHAAGIAESTVLVGVPRFSELLMATKNPKGVGYIVPFVENNKTLKDIRGHVQKNGNIQELYFENIVKTSAIIEYKQDEEWYESFKILYSDYFTNYQHCIKFEIDYDILYEYKITIQEVVAVLEEKYTDIHCVFSPIAQKQLDIFIETINIKLPSERVAFVDTENMYEIYMEEVVLPKLEKTLISGINNAGSVFYHNKNEVWYADVNSSKKVHTKSTTAKESASRYLKLLTFPGVDTINTLSNNMWDVYQIFGIEAAREFLIQEFMSIMSGINICHVKLLVERMTFGGTITSISRYAMRKDGGGALGKASFEECLDNLLNAALSGEVEPITGVSSSIICGKMAKTGTGCCELKIDFDKLPDINDGPVLLKDVEEEDLSHLKNVKVLRPKK